MWSQVATGQIAIYPLRDVRAGQHAIGKTVFQGNKIEEFQVEILGVLENVGPRQSIILARLSGGPLAQTGVMQGMSGSPVYIDGRLVGAVALAFNFSKEPIAGIRPIEEMLAVGDSGRSPAPKVASNVVSNVDSFASKLIDIATPVSFSGFTAGTLEQFAPQLKKLGLEPRQNNGLPGPDVLQHAQDFHLEVFDFVPLEYSLTDGVLPGAHLAQGEDGDLPGRERRPDTPRQKE